jgi:predicted PurR-regulated permease PerM
MSAPARPPEVRAGVIAARVGGGLGLLAATYWVIQPFIVPLIWAGILAYATWPLYRWTARVTRRPRLAAGLFTAAVGLGVGVPVASVLVALAQEATHLIGVVREWLDAGLPFPDWVLARPWLADRLTELKRDSVIEPTAVVSYATRYASQVTGKLSLFFFYCDGERLATQAARFVLIAFPRAPRVLEHVGGVVRAVVFGLIGTALVQGVIAGIGYALFGVPSPVALGALTFVASFIPAGPAILWAGASIWLLLGGHTTAAIGMAVYGLLLVSSIDNVLRPLLISGGEVPVHFLIVFFGVLGGLAAFGMLGLFLGPVLLSVTFVLAQQFARQTEEAAAG